MLQWLSDYTASLGGTATALVVVGFLSRSLLDRWLQKAATEHQITYGHLAPRKLEALEALYAASDEVITRLWRVFTALHSLAESHKDQSSEELRTRAGMWRKDSIEVTEPLLETKKTHGIYLDDDVTAFADKVGQDTLMWALNVMPEGMLKCSSEELLAEFAPVLNQVHALRDMAKRKALTQ